MLTDLFIWVGAALMLLGIGLIVAGLTYCDDCDDF